ncbi:MAG: hypothetical protein ABFQ62_01565 [Patescibacteria group bacterium]
MKFTQVELAGSGKTRYVFALGKKEAEILLGLLEKAYRFTPKTTETSIVCSHIGNMLKEIRNARGFIRS